MTSPSAVSVIGLDKRLGSKAVLRGLDLEVRPGTITAVLGPSGVGKTTLLRSIAGFEQIDGGTISLHGRLVAGPAANVPPERRRLGYVPQEGALFPHLSVAANVSFGLARAERGHRVDELLELVGLGGFNKRMPHELSGGEQQRVALARALAPRPDTVLLDEPFSALDPALRTSLRTDIGRALRASETTALLVTHDQLEALSLADSVAVMRDGRLIQTGDPATVYQQPVDAEVAQFVGDAILLSAELADGQARCALGTLSIRGTQNYRGSGTIMLRPEQLLLDAGDSGVEAEVRSITYYGHDADVLLDLPDAAHGIQRIVARVSGHHLPSLGATTRITVQGDAVAYIDPGSGTPS
jgi:iron(III) transport system ATP-binding protein